MATPKKMRASRTFIGAIFIATIASYAVLAAFLLPSGSITGFFIGSPSGIFSADFEQARNESANMPVGFYLKAKYHPFYDLDADDAEPGYEIADRQNRGLRGNAMLVDTTKLSDPEKHIDHWLESATISVSGGEQYTLSFSEKFLAPTSGGDFITLSLQEFDASYAGLSSDDILNFNENEAWSNVGAEIQTQNIGDWKKITVNFVTKPDTSYVRFKLSGYYSQNKGQASLLFDNFQLG